MMTLAIVCQADTEKMKADARGFSSSSQPRYMPPSPVRLKPTAPSVSRTLQGSPAFSCQLPSSVVRQNDIAAAATKARTPLPFSRPVPVPLAVSSHGMTATSALSTLLSSQNNARGGHVSPCSRSSPASSTLSSDEPTATSSSSTSLTSEVDIAAQQTYQRAALPLSIPIPGSISSINDDASAPSSISSSSSSQAASQAFSRTTLRGLSPAERLRRDELDGGNGKWKDRIAFCLGRIMVDEPRGARVGVVYEHILEYWPHYRSPEFDDHKKQAIRRALMLLRDTTEVVVKDDENRSILVRRPAAEQTSNEVAFWARWGALADEWGLP